MSKIKLALIPPHSLLGYTVQSNYQLALPHIGNKQYIMHYQELADRDDYIILDNGVAEGWEIAPKALHEFAKYIGAREIVLPDVMGDLKATLASVEKTLSSESIDPDRFAYMGVLQGSNEDEFKECVEEWLDKTEIKVLGLPRHMLKTCGLVTSRIMLAKWIIEQFGDSFELHFLGMDGNYPLEAELLGRAFNSYEHYMVRGLDTSMPFNYAFAKETFLQYGQPTSRPVDYFDLPEDAFPERILKSNIFTLQNWLGVPK